MGEEKQTLMAVADALARVLGGVSVLPSETVSLNDAAGRVLAEDVSARVDHPPADVSSMDGYAVRSPDVAAVPVTLKLVGESSAGSGFEGTVGPGETSRIFTGAPLPEGADTVVIQEDTERDGDSVTMLESSHAGRYVRPAGLDFKKGQTLLKAGTVLQARHIGLAAGMNVPELTVRRKPRVALLSNGNELVEPGEPAGPHQIINSNTFALAAFVRDCGGEPVNLGIARDTVESLREKIVEAQKTDLLVTMGGASVGDYDLVQQVLGKEGFDLGFYRIAMRPGKPLIFGHMGKLPVLGLPGNPVSVGVTAMIFLKPALETMLGIPRENRPAETALLGCDLGENDRRQDYLRSSLSFDGNGNRVATPFDKQDSSMMANLARADCLVVRAPHAPAITQGERVEIVLLP
ncbi:MAG: molybdopterin molybdotransferase MoeA [Rhodospirillales bacterium]